MGCKALQSPDTLRQLNAIDRDLIEARVRAIFDLREMGDIPGMMKYAAPDIVCFPNDFWRPVAFPRPIQGYDAVFEVFRLRNAHYENLASEIHRLLVDGDQVAVHRTVTLRDRGGSDVYSTENRQQEGARARSAQCTSGAKAAGAAAAICTARGAA